MKKTTTGRVGYALLSQFFREFDENKIEPSARVVQEPQLAA